MVRKPFLIKLFDAASMQRWNDKIRPVELRELDKQAHKMIIAYLLARVEEERGTPGLDRLKIIEGGIFGLLQRLVLTDIKPQLLDRIKNDREKYIELNQWVYDCLYPVLSPLGAGFCAKFKAFLLKGEEDINQRVLDGAHIYASQWEFEIVERANPNGYEIGEIKNKLQKRLEQYYDLEGVRRLVLYPSLRNFIDLCGQLRFQVRWSHLYIIPRVSVLGHMLIVAILSYLFSREIGACPRRCTNNYFTGLFHDLPEVLTRDIIQPVKKSVSGLGRLIKEYEGQEMEERIYKLLPREWHGELRMFTENEFAGIARIDGRVRTLNSDEISASCNEDRYAPRDGELVKAADRLCAFIESYLTLRNGIHRPEMDEAKSQTRREYRGKVICGIPFGEIYADFD